MKIEYTVPLRRLIRPRLLTSKPAADEPQGRAHRIARILALAHRLDELVRSAAVRDYGELARLGHVASARICQFLTLLHLARAIQELPAVSERRRYDSDHRTRPAQDRARARLGTTAG